MYSMQHLDRLKKLDMLAKDSTSAFWQYDHAALSDGAIPKKYKELMAVAVALTTQCPYCIELHKRTALEAGATEEQLAEVIHVAAVMRAGAAITHGTHLLGDGNTH
jgi:AhpD family alkylhydroperoxidase